MSWWGVREFLWSATLLVVLGALFLARAAYVVLRTHNPRPATATRPRDGKASIAIFLGSGAYPSLFCNYSAHLEALHRRTHGGDDAPCGRHELDPVLDSNVPHLLRRLTQRRESTTTRGHYPHWLRALPPSPLLRTSPAASSSSSRARSSRSSASLARVAFSNPTSPRLSQRSTPSPSASGTSPSPRSSSTPASPSQTSSSSTGPAAASPSPCPPSSPG